MMTTSEVSIPAQNLASPGAKAPPEPKHHHRASRRDSTSTQNSTSSRRSERPPARPVTASKPRVPVVVPHQTVQVAAGAYVPAVQPWLRVALILTRLLQLGACGISMYANHQGLQGLKMMRAMGIPHPGGVLALGGPIIAVTIIDAMLSLLWIWLAIAPQHRPHAYCCASCGHLLPYMSDVAWDALLVCWWGGVLVAILVAHIPTVIPIVACSLLCGLHVISVGLSGRACAVQLAADREARVVTASVVDRSVQGKYRIPGMV